MKKNSIFFIQFFSSKFFFLFRQNFGAVVFFLLFLRQMEKIAASVRLGSKGAGKVRSGLRPLFRRFHRVLFELFH